MGGRNYRDMRKFLRVIDHVHYLDCTDGFMSVYICQNSSYYTLEIYAVYCMLIIPQQHFQKIIDGETKAHKEHKLLRKIQQIHC